MSNQWLSRLALKVEVVGDKTTSSGKEFQVLITLWVKKFDLDNKCDCFFNSFMECPLVLWTELRVSILTNQCHSNHLKVCILIHPRHLNNASNHSYFHRLSLLWNAMPVIDLNLYAFQVIKQKFKSHFSMTISTAHVISSFLVQDATNRSLPSQIYTTYSNLNKFN